jgi:hypothetical protein
MNIKKNKKTATNTNLAMTKFHFSESQSEQNVVLRDRRED